MDNGSLFEVYTDVQFASRKRKGKKKRKSSHNIQVNTGQKSDNSDAVVEPIENGGQNMNHGDTNVMKDCRVDGKVCTDGKLKAEPNISEVKYEQVKLLQLDETELISKITHLKLESVPIVRDGKGTYNVRALSNHAETYELETFEKNVLLIFNQEKIQGYQDLRYGTKEDGMALDSTFKRFGFEVMEYMDKTKKDILDILESFFKEDFTNYGCVGIAVLTHGSDMGLLWAKDQQYSEIEIINHFKVHDKPTLVAKPKFLIIQACRESKIIPGVPVFRSGKIRPDMDASTEPYILPSEADILILHSSYVGSPSHRDAIYGSWLIQSLCNKINQLAVTHDFESIITEVKRDVAIDKEHEIYNRVTLEMQVNKQMAVMTSTLIRKLYLKKFGDPVLMPVTSLADGGTCYTCKNGWNEVLNYAPPTARMLVEFGPCSCFLEHFEYMKSCLRYFLKENPEDDIAESYLEVAKSFEDGVKFNDAKEKLAKAMCKHFTTKAKRYHYYKYLYFYKHFKK